jgi:hypothetical protein
MKVLLILSAICFLGVFGYPDPDHELKLGPDPVVGGKEDVAAVDIDVESDAAVFTEMTTRKPPRKSWAQGTALERTRVIKDLMAEYEKRVNPDNVKLNFGMLLFDFKVNEYRNSIDSYIWLTYEWVDSRLSWDPTKYNGVETIRLPPSSVWVPDVTLYNSADPVHMLSCWESDIVIKSNGELSYIPPCKMSSTCKLNLKREPYGEQNCSFKFGSWTLDGNVLDLQLKKDSADAIELSQLIDKTGSSGFEVLSTSAQRNQKFYPCCEEPYTDLTFNMTIRRLPGEELLKKL